MKHISKTTKIVILLATIVALALGIVFNLSASKEKNQKLSIVATNFPAYDFARAVAGNIADIKMLIKPGVEIHDFEPTPQNIIDIENSAMFIYTGGESDAWLEDVLSSINSDTKLVKMMDAANVVTEAVVDGMESDKNTKLEYDEHVWTSPKNAIKIINRIKTELTTLFPDDAKILADNAEAYINKLSDLDQAFRNVVKNANRKTLIFGDRFPLRYFVDEYDLDYYAAFPGCSEQTEASSKTIAFLISKIQNEKIPVVFKTEMGDPKLADAISRETGAKVLEFQTMHNISADDFNNGTTYVDLMYQNLAVLEEALK